ncbi:MAG: LPS export ABC transporter permease LptG [Steroidobacteraceae bacterium]
MSVLSRYIIRAVLGYTALVMAVLLMLIGLYLFLTQLDELGSGRYGALDALVVVACRLPQQAFTLLPIGALMGSLLALGNLARSSELIVMRASGVSVFRLAGWVAMAGVLLTILTWGIGDYLAPPAEQFASRYKSLAKTNQYSTIGSEDLWAKDGNVFLSVQKQNNVNSFGGVYVLRFDEQRRLQSVGRADAAELGDGRSWRLKRYAETRFETDRTIATQQPNLQLDTNLSAEFLGAAATDPENLTGTALLRYIRYLNDNRLESNEYRTAFWSRVARTCTLLIIVMLAVPFSFGPMRSTGTGTRMVVGVLVGALFFLLAKLLSNGGTVYNLDPLIIAWGPTAVLAVVTAIAIAKVR